MRFGNVKNATGVVTINKNWCKGCGFCIQYCPTKVLTASPEYNKKGYHPPVVTSAENCRDCGFCQVICPEFAIFVKGDSDEGSKERDAETTARAEETHRAE
jgi:2-oxoglutarate ferredoxin oxidoreductase subunit delta